MNQTLNRGLVSGGARGVISGRARGVIVFVVGNEHGDSSSKPGGD